MNLPNWIRLQAKQSATTKIMMQNLRIPGTIPHLRYDVMSKESYERNVAVYLCVHLIATSAAGVPWFLSKKARAGAKSQRLMTKSTAYRSEMFRGVRQGAVQKHLRTTEIENHPALTLLERPNPFESQAEYMVRMISFFLLAGNSFEEFVTPDRKGAAPLEMWSLRPDRTTVLPNTQDNRARYAMLAQIVDETTPVLGYNYHIGTSDQVFAPDSMLHRKFFHPTDDFYGLSPLQVAARYYRTDNLSADWNFALLQNQARPSGALIAPTTIGDDTYERLKQELQENYGGANTGVPMILEGGFDWKQLGLSPLEMDWLAGTRDSRAMICAAYHVPPEMTGDPEHRTYNSMPEARRALWMEAIMPVLDAVRDSYNRTLVPRFGDGLYLDYDRDQIDALAEDQEKVWTRVGTAKMLTVNEQREAVGYDDYMGDPETDTEADVPEKLIPRLTTQIPFGGSPAPDGAPAGGGGTVVPPAVPGKAMALKAQSLTGAQKRARKILSQEMASHYRKQGLALSSYLKNAISKL
jgi:HK97 family phage portal protein